LTIELTEEERIFLDAVSDDWYSLQETTREWRVSVLNGPETVIPTEAVVRSLLAKGLITVAWVSHYGRPVRTETPQQPPDVVRIDPDELQFVLANPDNWTGAEWPARSVEITTTDAGESVLRLSSEKIDDD
jgi:hypothetical protein